MKKSDYVPPIVFTDLKVNGKKSTVSTDDLKEIALHPSERNINVQFSALDFTRPDDIRYAYRLEGLEKNGIIAIKTNQQAISIYPQANIVSK